MARRLSETCTPHETAIGPEKGADIALTFRNVHNWMARGLE